MHSNIQEKGLFQNSNIQKNYAPFQYISGLISYVFIANFFFEKKIDFRSAATLQIFHFFRVATMLVYLV